MDPTTTDEQLPPPPQPPQPHRSSTSCDRHPQENFTGFCASCLCERLAVLDKDNNPSASSSVARKSTSSAIKSLFKVSNSDGFLPELRRTKSFCARKNEGFLGFSGVFEPQRKSCDVRGRSTLSTLFTQDDGRPVSAVVIDSKEEEEEFHDSTDNGGEKIEAVREDVVGGVNSGEIVKEEEEEECEKKTMKDHIDLDSQNKKVGTKDFKELAGSFWSAASVFSKKLRSWTKKNNHNHNQKMKKHNGSRTVQVNGKKDSGGRNNYRDTQSEIADYGYGRMSCDTDPRLSFDVGRFSVDAGRISFDDPRCSFDEPRASWDGYLIGRTFPRMVPPMVSVVEDPPLVVSRKDGQIPVEEPRRSSVSINGDDYCVPGGAAQTKDYYSDSSSKRRKSFDRSSSVRKSNVDAMDEIKANNGLNAKISPGSLAGDRDLRDSNSNSRSLRDDYSESFDIGFRDNASVIGNGERKGPKKSRRWRGWNIWGLIYRRGNAKDEDDDRYSSRTNGVERSLSESWQDLRREGYVDPRLAFNRNMLRSSSSVSWRNSYNIGGSFGNIRKGSIEPNNGRKKHEEFVLERNRSARYSPTPSHADNGLLRLYLAPMKGSRRGGSGKPKPAYSHSFARSVLRLY